MATQVGLFASKWKCLGRRKLYYAAKIVDAIRMDAGIALRYDAEARHFDALVDETGESWWGHNTPGGRLRSARRAQIVAKAIPLGVDCRVFEIAAGAGALTEAVLRLAPETHLTATDISSRSVRRLRDRVRNYTNVECVEADITNLMLEPGRFDAVIGNSALHHVDVPRCLGELFRILKPGGRLVIFEPNLANPEVFFETMVARSFATRRLNYSEEERTYTRFTYAKFLRAAGFVNVNVRPFDFLHPITPAALLPAVRALGRLLEWTPITRELSGSLVLSAAKA